MSARYEIWTVENTGTSGGMLKPGRVLRALASGLGLRAEEIGQIIPTGRQGVSVEVRLPRAGEVATPLLLPVAEGASGTAFLIQREDDEPPVGDREILLTWDQGAGPGPGAVSVALSIATDGAVGPEEIGVGLGGPGWVRVRVPETLASHLAVPGTLTIGERQMTLTWADGSKKKLLRSAERRLAESLGVTRKRIDAGRIPVASARLRLAETSRRLLREHPGDGPLQQAVGRLAERGFAPPEPTELPSGSPTQMWADLSGRAAEDIGALAATLVTLPDPTQDLPRAVAAMEVLLAETGEQDRCVRLLTTLREHLEPSTAALWDLRVQGETLTTTGDAGQPARWEEILESLRTSCKGAPEVMAAGLHRAACGWWSAEARPSGPTPVLGGRRLALLALTRWRHPDRVADLAPATAWLGEAAELGPMGVDDPLGAALDAMEALDLAGDFDGAGQALGSAVDIAGDRPDLRRVVEARATLLNVGADAATQVLPRPALPSPFVAPPQAPGGSWETRITSVTAGPVDTSDEGELAWLEAVGLTVQAAEGWLSLGTPEGLLHAWRLRAHLDAAATRKLTATLQEATPDGDELLLQSSTGLACGLALHDILAPGPGRRILGVRLDVATGEPEEPGLEDPHSTSHRLEAAVDHMAEGRHVGAATAAASLLQRVEDIDLAGRLLNLVVDLLSLSSPPTDLVRAVNRALRSGEDLRAPLLRRLATTPEAVESLLDTLSNIAADKETSEHEALLALRGLLGHCSTDEEPLSSATVRAMTGGGRAALMAVAAAIVGQRPDPVSAAREALLRTPPARSSGESVARELLTLATSD